GRSRVSGEMFIAPAAPKNHCQSRAKGPLSFRAALRAVDRKIVGHYKYFGPAALCFIAALLIANISILSITARAQRKSAAPATPADVLTLAILYNVILILGPSPQRDGVKSVAYQYRKPLRTPLEGCERSELHHLYGGHDDNRDWFKPDLKEPKPVTRLLWRE